MSEFAGLSIALTALYAQRQGMEVAGHNVANANTEGYSRQRVGLEARGGQVTPAVHAVWRGAGAGVEVARIDRLRDQFLENRALTEHGVDVGLRETQKVLGRVELVFGEPGDTGIAAQLADFWAAWDDVANRPGDLAARTQLLERVTTVTNGFNQAAADLAGVWDASVEQLRITVVEANATAARVAELNNAIERAVKSGLSPNDLADQRDLLVMRLGELVGATAKPGDHGVVDVFVGGTSLVRGARAEALTADVPSGTSIADASTPVRVTWAKDGYPANGAGGVTGGLLDAVNRVLPGYLAGLDAVAARLATTVNTQHAAGVDLAGAPGGPLFSGATAATLARDAGIVGPTQLAAAGPGGDRLDGSNALALAELATARDGADELFRSFVVRLGVDAQAANRRVDIQAGIVRQVDIAREAEAGVNLDEEMTNMVAFQHAYDAAARFLTAVDAMLDTLINRTGLIGR